ncbi:hypothetical protein, partial [Streptomyces sp. NPDC002547]
MAGLSYPVVDRVVWARWDAAFADAQGLLDALSDEEREELLARAHGVMRGRHQAPPIIRSGVEPGSVEGDYLELFDTMVSLIAARLHTGGELEARDLSEELRTAFGTRATRGLPAGARSSARSGAAADSNAHPHYAFPVRQGQSSGLSLPGDARSGAHLMDIDQESGPDTDEELFGPGSDRSSSPDTVPAASHHYNLPHQYRHPGQGQQDGNLGEEEQSSDEESAGGRDWLAEGLQGQASSSGLSSGGVRTPEVAQLVGRPTPFNVDAHINAYVSPAARRVLEAAADTVLGSLPGPVQGWQRGTTLAPLNSRQIEEVLAAAQASPQATLGGLWDHVHATYDRQLPADEIHRLHQAFHSRLTASNQPEEPEAASEPVTVAEYLAAAEAYAANHGGSIARISTTFSVTVGGKKISLGRWLAKVRGGETKVDGATRDALTDLGMRWETR